MNFLKAILSFFKGIWSFITGCVSVLENTTKAIESHAEAMKIASEQYLAEVKAEHATKLKAAGMTQDEFDADVARWTKG